MVRFQRRANPSIVFEYNGIFCARLDISNHEIDWYRLLHCELNLIIMPDWKFSTVHINKCLEHGIAFSIDVSFSKTLTYQIQKRNKRHWYCCTIIFDFDHTNSIGTWFINHALKQPSAHRHTHTHIKKIVKCLYRWANVAKIFIQVQISIGLFRFERSTELYMYVPTLDIKHRMKKKILPYQ